MLKGFFTAEAQRESQSSAEKSQRLCGKILLFEYQRFLLGEFIKRRAAQTEIKVFIVRFRAEIFIKIYCGFVPF